MAETEHKVHQIYYKGELYGSGNGFSEDGKTLQIKVVDGIEWEPAQSGEHEWTVTEEPVWQTELSPKEKEDEQHYRINAETGIVQFNENGTDNEEDWVDVQVTKDGKKVYQITIPMSYVIANAAVIDERQKEYIINEPTYSLDVQTDNGSRIVVDGEMNDFIVQGLRVVTGTQLGKECFEPEQPIPPSQEEYPKPEKTDNKYSDYFDENGTPKKVVKPEEPKQEEGESDEDFSERQAQYQVELQEYNQWNNARDQYLIDMEFYTNAWTTYNTKLKGYTQAYEEWKTLKEEQKDYFAGHVKPEHLYNNFSFYSTCSSGDIRNEKTVCRIYLNTKDFEKNNFSVKIDNTGSTSIGQNLKVGDDEFRNTWHNYATYAISSLDYTLIPNNAVYYGLALWCVKFDEKNKNETSLQPYGSACIKIVFCAFNKKKELIKILRPYMEYSKIKYFFNADIPFATEQEFQFAQGITAQYDHISALTYSDEVARQNGVIDDEEESGDTNS